MGPDPSNHSSIDFTLGPDPSVHNKKYKKNLLVWDNYLKFALVSSIIKIKPS